MKKTLRFSFACLLGSLCLSLVPAANADTVLYDPNLGTLPNQQGWLSVVDNSTTQSMTGGFVNLNTTADRNDQSGYFSEDPFNGTVTHPNMPVLDRAAGYTVSFQVQVLSEEHNNRDDNNDGKLDRAGFSVIAISQDLAGLELGFFENRVWAYATAGEGTNSLFTQAEGVAFDTTASLVNYDLSIQGDNYQLSANSQSILSGSLRNYNPSGLPPLIDPYNNPSFLFFGDDTTSADSNVLLGRVEVLNSAIPEPNSLLVIGCSGMLLSYRRRRT